MAQRNISSAATAIKTLITTFPQKTLDVTKQSAPTAADSNTRVYRGLRDPHGNLDGTHPVNPTVSSGRVT
jgi:hypothetical protein